MATTSRQIYKHSLTITYHLKIKNSNKSVKIRLQTKHHSHVIFTNKFQFLKPDSSTIQSKTNVFYSLGYASHKSNPLSVSQGYMGGGNMCEGHTFVEGYTTGLWSTLAKLEGIMLKVALHWGSDSSVMNDSLGELGHNPLYVGLLSVWGSMDSKHMFSPHFVGQLLN